jgi:hypothetical protein
MSSIEGNYNMELRVNPCPKCGVERLYVVKASVVSCFFKDVKLAIFGCESPGCTGFAWSNLNLIEASPNYGKIEGLRTEFELPLQMVTDFKEALGCYLQGYYNASVVMSRRLLERILLGKGTKPGQRICDMIKDLANRGILDSRLKGLCDDIKYFGNVGAHPDEEEASKSDAQTALHFTEFLVAWLFGRVEENPH